MYGKYFEDEPLHHDGGWSPSSFLQNSVRNLSHGFLLCTEASSVNCTHQNNVLSHQHISFEAKIAHYKGTIAKGVDAIYNNVFYGNFVALLTQIKNASSSLTLSASGSITGTNSHDLFRNTRSTFLRRLRTPQ